MKPYRTLFVRDAEPPRRDLRELRGLAFLMIVLGLLRLLPSIASAEPIGIEASVAAIMIVIGAAIALDLPRRARQGAAAWRERSYLRGQRETRPRPRSARTIRRR
jgi:hypothetical protein